MKNFEELNLIAPLARALKEEQYETPTPIQAKTIPAALSGRDVLGCAQTGTGKTASFALPILNRLGKRKSQVRPGRPLTLVLAPTRELAIQIGTSFSTYGKHLPLRHAVVYGGVSQVKQVRMLQRGVHVLVATPGRLLDLMNQGHIDLQQLDVFVLDEVDRMLDMGFLPDLRRIIGKLPSQRQSLFFSATLPPNITALAKGLLRDPVTVNVTPASPSVERIEQRVMFVERGGKQRMLQTIVEGKDVDRALVFTRTKRQANAVTAKLARTGIRAAAIHGNKSQNARQQALAAFESKRIQVLVATDVASRGIDIEGISHVINFDLPTEPESYVHRIGRTGRAGGSGIAISFCTAEEQKDLQAIERLVGKRLSAFDEQGRPVAGNSGGTPRRRGTSSNGKRRSPGNSRQTSQRSRAPGASAGNGQPSSRRRNGNNRRRVAQTT